MKPPRRQKRLPFRRRPTSQNDQILRDRNKFEKQNAEISQYIIENPHLVDWNLTQLECAAIVINPPLEDDGEELRIVSE